MTWGSTTRSTTSTLTQARQLASRIAAELKQLQVFYGKPTSTDVEKFALEAEQYLSAGFLDHVRYGFKRNGDVIFELRYTAEAASGIDDKPGRVPVGLDIRPEDQWFSYLVPSDEWDRRSPAERDAFERDLPLHRTAATYPTYSAGVGTGNVKRFSEDSLGLRREIRLK